MKIITLSEIGYNHPSQANWSYGIWKLDLIDTTQTYCMSHTLKETFGGDSRFISKVRESFGVEVIKTKGVFEQPKVTGVSKMLDLESDEVLEIVKEFIS